MGNWLRLRSIGGKRGSVRKNEKEGGMAGFDVRGLGVVLKLGQSDAIILIMSSIFWH